MSIRRVTPILLLTGFLGSGKTSLLARWVTQPEFAGALVIINELGEVGIDDRLVQSSSDAPLLLENGCACCAAGEDLSATLERLFWQRLHREIRHFSWVLIETTGVADPEPILARLAGHELLRERYRVEGVVTAFDARHGPAQLARHPECGKQLEAARLVVITKTDLASHNECRAADAAVTARAPHATIVRSARASLDAAALLEHLTAPAPAIEAPGGGGPAPAHDHLHEHAHGALPHAAHSEAVGTAFLPLERALSRTTLEAALGGLAARFGGSLLRLKGIAAIEGAAGWQSVQWSGDEGLLLEALPERPGSEPRTGVTIIAQHRPAAELARDLAERLDVPVAVGTAAGEAGSGAGAF